MKKNRIQMLFGILAVLVIGSGIYLYMQISKAGDRWPANNAPGTLTRQVTQLNADIKKLEVDVKRIPTAEAKLAAVKVDYEFAARVLPRENSPDHLIAAIRTKAEQSGVNPTSLQPGIIKSRAAGRGKKATSPLFEIWRFTLDIQGDYDQIATFVNRMEEFESADAEQTGSEKRFFELLNITIAAQESGLANLGPAAVGGPVRHTCNLTMQTYRYTGE